MKNHFKTVFFLFMMSLTLSGQESVRNMSLNEDLTVYRNFKRLPQIKYLDSVAGILKKVNRFNSIHGCLRQLHHFTNSDELNYFLYARLRDIAKQLIIENHPVLLFRGTDDFISSHRHNGKFIEIANLHYDSGSIVTKPLAYGMEEFNIQIHNSLKGNN